MNGVKILCYCLLLSSVFGCKKKSSKSTPVNNNTGTTDSVVFAKGADVSWVTQMESSGYNFYDSAGTQTDCFQLMKELGMNAIRLRVWVNPMGGWNDSLDVMNKAVRANNLGLKVMLDFHYSDTWADPGTQTKPAAWASLGTRGINKPGIHTHL